MTSETDNEKQLKAFFNSEYHNLKAYVHSKIKNDADRDAEDIIQDVALKIFSRKSVLPINNIGGFVYYSIKNKIIDTLRKRKRNSSIEEEAESKLTDFIEQFYGNSDNSYSNEMKSELKKAIYNLKPHYREIIIAVDIEGYTYRELSEETGIPEGTLLSRRHRAVSLLFKELEKKKEIIN